MGGNRWIWGFGMKNGVGTRFGKKQPVWTCQLFPKFIPKNHRLGHLEPIWNGFDRSKYLVIWAFGQKANDGMQPVETHLFDKTSQLPSTTMFPNISSIPTLQSLKVIILHNIYPTHNMYWHPPKKVATMMASGSSGIRFPMASSLKTKSQPQQQSAMTAHASCEVQL
jgi:hypothetical protein